MIAEIEDREVGASVRAKLNLALGKINDSESMASAAIAAPVTFGDIAKGLQYAFTWTPSGPTSQAVVAAIAHTFEVDTSGGDVTGVGHFVGRLVKFTAQGGGTLAQCFLDEFRIGVLDGSIIGSAVVKKLVLEADADVAGSVSAVVLEEMSDHSNVATWLTTIRRNYLDPRTVTTHAGGIVQQPKVIAGDYTLLESDSGKSIMLFDTEPRTITLPDTLPDGFTIEIVQGNSGAAIFATGGGRTLFEPQSRSQTQGAFKIGRLTAYTSTVAVLELT